MMPVKSGFTQGKNSALIRLCGLLSLIVFSAAGLLLMAPVDAPTNREVVVAEVRRQADKPLLFARFSEFQGSRSSLFEFAPIERASVEWYEKPLPEPIVSETQPPDPVKIAKPLPNTNGLRLVGTVPGTKQAFALIEDANDSIVHMVKQGGQIRNLVVEDIARDQIIVSLHGERAGLVLEPLGGSEAGQREQPVIARDVQLPISASQTPASKTATGVGETGLGVKGIMLTGSSLAAFDLTSPGLLITDVLQAGSALSTGDVLTTIEDKPFSSLQQIASLLRTKSTGDVVAVEFVRFGRNRSLTVTIP